MRLVNDFLVGCDPEFVGINREGEAVNWRSLYEHEGEVGWDHAGWVLEMRPKPATGTWVLVKRIAAMVEKLLPGTRYRAGAYCPSGVQGRHNLTLGGHVHIDLNPYAHVSDVWDGTGTTQVHRERVAALDGLTQCLEKLDILPQRESERRRSTSEYGKYGDVRVQGNYPRFHTEYRTMASWLYDPKVAMLCLTGAKLAAAQPEVTREKLNPINPTFDGLKGYFEMFQEKDVNAARVMESVLNNGLKPLQVDPGVDFRERWRTL